MLRKDSTRAEIIMVSGFASMFLILGIACLMFFSTGSILSCDKRTDQCLLSYEYVLSKSQQEQWSLSQTKYLFLEKQESTSSQDSSSNASSRSVTHRHRAIFVLSDGRRIPFMRAYTGGTEQKNTLVKEFQVYLFSTPSTPEYRNQFKHEEHYYMVSLGGLVSILLSFCIFWYDLIRKD